MIHAFAASLVIFGRLTRSPSFLSFLQSPSLSQILLAYDKTHDADLALTYVLTTLDLTPSDHVIFTTVLPPSALDPATLVYEAMPYDPEVDRKWLTKMNQVALERLKDKAEVVREKVGKGVGITVHVARE